MNPKDDSASAPGLNGKVAVVVGGGRGIGRATAHKLASAGAEVILAARTPEALDAVVAEIRAGGGRAVGRALDITQSAEVRQFAGWIRETYGRIDILVNSAGLPLIASIEATSEDAWDQVFATNLRGVFLCIQTMIDLLRASQGALVVNIASKVGLTGHRLVSAYAAAKGGVVALSRSLAHELKSEGIRVVALCPGPVDTPMRWAATPDLDPGSVISADSVASMIHFLACMDDRVATGEIVLEAVTYEEQAVPLQVQ